MERHQMSAAKKQPRVQRKEQTRSITYRLPAKLVEELETEAAQRRISQNVLVRQIIESYMQWGGILTRSGWFSSRRECCAELSMM